MGQWRRMRNKEWRWYLWGENGRAGGDPEVGPPLWSTENYLSSCLMDWVLVLRGLYFACRITSTSKFSFIHWNVMFCVWQEQDFLQTVVHCSKDVSLESPHRSSSWVWHLWLECIGISVLAAHSRGVVITLIVILFFVKPDQISFRFDLGWLRRNFLKMSRCFCHHRC